MMIAVRKVERRMLVSGLVGLAAIVISMTSLGVNVNAINELDAEQIVVDFAEFAGLGEVSEDLQNRLEASVMEAARLSIVDYAVLVEEGVVNTEQNMEQILERMSERFMEQERRWETIAPDWRAAFEQIREPFRLCVENEDLECLNEMRLMLQFQHALEVESTFQSRLGQVDDSAGDELVMQLERSRQRIETMLRNGDSEMLNRLQVMTKDMEQLQTRLQQQLAEHMGQSNGSTSSTVAPGKGQP
jgi:hypothetical protein